MCAEPLAHILNLEHFAAETETILLGNIVPGFTVSSGHVTLSFGTDSNLTLSTQNAVLWQTNTAGRNAANLIVQEDGNIVMYSTNGQAMWASHTNGKGKGPYTWFLIDNNNSGSLKLQDSTGLVVWQSVDAEKSNDLRDIAVRFAPVIQLDSHEPFRPISVTDFVRNSSREEVAENIILRYNGLLGPPSKDDMNAKLAYYATETTRGGREFYSLLYICHWTTDDGYLEFLPGVPLLDKVAHVGSHAGDIEHVRVIVEKATMTVARAFFSAHGPTDGKWMFPEELLFYDANRERIFAFAALGNHGMYPLPGVYVRGAILVSDSNDGEGLLWNTSPQLTTEPYPREVLLMNGSFKFGSPGIGLAHNQWWWRDDVSKSATAWWRMWHPGQAGLPDHPAADLTLTRDQVRQMTAHAQTVESLKWGGICALLFVLTLLGFVAAAVTPWGWFLAAPVLLLWVIILFLVGQSGAFWLGFH